MKSDGLKKNMLLQSAYQLLTLGIPLITTPYLTRTLGAGGLGSYSYAYSIAYYFVMFMQLGLNNYGNREIAKVRNDKDILSTTFLGIYSVQLMCSFLSIVVYIIYICFFANNVTYMLLLLPYVLSGAIDINWFFFGLEEFKLTVTRNTIIKIITTICIFTFVQCETDATKYALIMTISILLSQLVMWPFVPGKVIVKKIEFNDIKCHIKPNLILFIPIVAVSLYKIMDKIMLGNLSNIDEVGLYDSSEKIIQIPLALITALGTVMLPRMSNMYAKGLADEANHFFLKSIEVAMFLSTSLSFGIMAVSKTFIPWFYGIGFEKCEQLFLILLPSCIFLAFANVIRTQYLVPKGKDIQFIISLLSGAVVNIIINIFLIPKLKSVGAAIGTLIAEIVVCLIQSIFVRHELPLKKCIIDSIPFVIAGIVMYLFVYRIKFGIIPIIFEIILEVLLGAIIYLGFFFVARKIIDKFNKSSI